MPLAKGRSKKVVSKNIGEMVRSYKKKGTIGTSTPANPEAARKQAIAIAFKKSGMGKKK